MFLAQVICYRLSWQPDVAHSTFCYVSIDPGTQPIGNSLFIWLLHLHREGNVAHPHTVHIYITQAQLVACMHRHHLRTRTGSPMSPRICLCVVQSYMCSTPLDTITTHRHMAQQHVSDTIYAPLAFFTVQIDTQTHTHSAQKEGFHQAVCVVC